MTIEQKITQSLLNNQRFKQNPLYEGLLNENFTWEYYSYLLCEYCPQYFDPNKFNWKDHSHYLAEFCPEHMDINKYNWKDDTWAVLGYCPEKLDLKKASLEDIIKGYPQYSAMSLKEIKQRAILNKL